ncbi:MAG: hypothetical protein IGBAC_2090 [Ignavibacteriae bacterium]|nr:MAG: hypothetical protein IGBAC_2090 [Ignavibacteriota bacterium]
MAYSGNTVMIGATGKNNFKGAVYVFEFDGKNWNEKQILTDPDEISGEYFGNSIDISEKRAVIAGYGRDVVLIYEYIEGNWIYRQTISRQTSSGYFGSSLFLKDDKLIIGEEGTVSTDYGYTHLYQYNPDNLQWEFVKTFQGNRKFGYSVAISSFNTYLISDYFSPPGSASGIVSAHKWNGNDWDSIIFAPPDSVSGDNFGYQISTSASKVFIGAPGCDKNPYQGIGAVYYFENDGLNLTQIQKIYPDSLIIIGGGFGSSLGSGTKRIVIGCAGENGDAPVYLYDSTSSGYTFKNAILPEFASTDNGFGSSIDVSTNDYFVVGAPGENTQRGAAYFFTPYFLGNAYDLDFYGGIFSSGNVSIDTVTISISELPPGYENQYTYSWLLNSGDSLVFDGGYVGSEITKLSKKTFSRLCWLKRNDQNSPWEYIGGELTGNYLKSTIPFNNSCQLVLVDSVGTSGVKEENTMQFDFALHQNYPNPFNPNTTIRFEIPKTTHVTLKIYNILGQEVAEMVNQELKQGVYNVKWNASNFASGVYVYRLKAGDPSTISGQNFISVKKMLLVK